MPNRIIREGIITSAPVNALSWGAEVFYRRLLNVADDFGRFHANVSLLRAYCYPLQLNKVSDSDIAKWLAETRKAGLVRVYSHDGKEILELDKFGQRVRAEKTKFPLPSDIRPSDDSHPPDIGMTSAHVVVDVDVDDRKALSGKPDLDEAREILEYLNRNAGKAYRPVESNLKLIVARLKSGVTPLQLREVVFAKCQQWGKDEKMVEYLRPATLFNATKFEQYLGEMSRGMSAVQN